MICFGGSRGNRGRTHTRFVREHAPRHTIANHGAHSTAHHRLAGKGVLQDALHGRHKQMQIQHNNAQPAQYIKHGHDRHDE